MTAASAKKARLLVVDDEENVLLTTGAILSDLGYEVETASSGRTAVQRISERPFDLVLTDLAMKECDGLEVLATVKRVQPDTVSIMVTGYASLDSAIEAIRLGAYDYLTKPTNIAEMCQTIERGLEKRRLTLELRERAKELAALNRLANVDVDVVLRSTKNLDEALARIAFVLSEFLAPAGAVLFHSNGRGLQPVSSYVRSERAHAWIADERTTALAREVVATLTPIQRQEAEYSVLAVPVEFQARLYGCMLICDAAPRVYVEEQIQAAQTIASRAALAIENAKLFREVDRERERLALIVNAVADGVIGLGPAGDIVFANRACERLLGVREAEIRGRPVGVLAGAHPSTEAIADFIARAAKGTSAYTTGEVLFLGPGRSEVFCDVVSTRLLEPGEGGIESVIALRDARERRRADEERTHALSYVTHELKTPLTAILAHTFLFASGKLGPIGERQVEALHVMKRNGNRLLGLIENMLATAQIASGSARYRYGPLRVAELLQELRESFEVVAAERDTAFGVEGGADVEIVGDRGMIAMALSNLLSNAFRFTDRGGRVSLSAKESGADLVLEVRDSGIGIPPEFHERIFHRFFQVDSSRGGSGLGLGIVKSIAESHGGSVRVESRPGEGSRFILSMPKAGPVPAEAPRPEPQVSAAEVGAR